MENVLSFGALAGWIQSRHRDRTAKQRFDWLSRSDGKERIGTTPKKFRNLSQLEFGGEVGDAIISQLLSIPTKYVSWLSRVLLSKKYQ
jgi:hypothetical protein